ncbi:hybrid sensor histidine kinase/response regulator [Flavobacterium sp. RHBU_3]|uniref:hybrid sensor histidine kinase/response regulator n=1 Tax=Flavobacterium sp. RHBU_3 TaxID=3391184 RepID=UPI0039852A44
MVQKPKAVKYKVISGYVLLFAVAVLSVWFSYTEILKITPTNRLSDDNARIIRISNTVAALYSSEAISRSAIISADKAELKRYFKLTDSIAAVIDSIKKQSEPSQEKKFDSIQLLIQRKKVSVADIFKFREDHKDDEYYSNAISGMRTAYDSVWQNIKPVTASKRNQYEELAVKLLSKKQFDSLSKLPISNDVYKKESLKVLQEMRKKSFKVNYQLYRREQKLLDENRVISDRLRALLSSLENESLKNSYAEISNARNTMSKTAKTLAWVGAGTLFLLIILAWVIIRDLSINQDYRRKLEILNRENEELLRTKGMLMATVTHDLQTPLNSILGFHELLKNSALTEGQLEYLDNIKESAGYIMKLVNDLLDFSKLENNRISIEEVPFNVKKIIETTCNSLSPMAEQKGIELNWDVEDVLDKNYLSDPYRIKQVLTNLVSNAIKFTNEGSVEVTAKIEGFEIAISVIDTGIGIAPDKHAAVFREFTQAHEGIEKKFGGTGLGLTISKRIIELLGGTITLESQEGQGTIFTITIPCIAAKNNTETPAENTNSIDISGKRIIVVDDDLMQLRLMKELLQNNGVIVTTEANAANVIALLETEPADVVLTDIQMPGMDGFDLVEKIRSHSNPNIASLPVMALSGRRDLEPVQYTEKGFTGTCHKPINFDALKALIAGVAPTTTPVADTTEKSEKLYDLRSLSQFTQNDPASLKLIIDTFTESSVDNCTELIAAAESHDNDRLARIAHKMIPMLKQMEVHSIAKLLLPIEEQTLPFKGAERITYCEQICAQMETLCRMLQKEIA